MISTNKPKKGYGGWSCNAQADKSGVWPSGNSIGQNGADNH